MRSSPVGTHTDGFAKLGVSVGGGAGACNEKNNICGSSRAALFGKLPYSSCDDHAVVLGSGLLWENCKHEHGLGFRV